MDGWPVASHCRVLRLTARVLSFLGVSRRQLKTVPRMIAAISLPTARRPDRVRLLDVAPVIASHMQSELRRTKGAIFKRGENNSWPGQYIVQGASEEKPTDGADHVRSPAKRAAANAAKRPIVVSENPVPADRQNKQPQRQEHNRLSQPHERRYD